MGMTERDVRIICIGKTERAQLDVGEKGVWNCVVDNEKLGRTARCKLLRM